MKNKPWPIIILSMLYFLAPIYNLLYFSHLFNMTPWQYLHTFPSILALVQFWLFFPIAGFAILSIKRWSFPVFLIIILWNFYRNYQTWSLSQGQFNVSLYILAEVANISVVAYFLIPAVRNVYFNPKLRWWEIAPRYQVSLPATIDQIPATIHNIAAGGVFLSRADSKQLQINSVSTMHLDLHEYSLNLECKAVHYDPSYLDGYGMQFINMTRSNKSTLSKLIKHIDTLGHEKREPVSMVEENILMWLINLFKTGKGLLPQTPDKLVTRQSKEQKN